MKPKKWPTRKIALCGALAGVVYGLFGESGRLLVGGTVSVALGYLAADAVIGAAIAASVSGIRNRLSR